MVTSSMTCSRRRVVYGVGLALVFLGFLAVPAWTTPGATYDEATDTFTARLGFVPWITSTRSVVAPPAAGGWRSGRWTVHPGTTAALAAATLVGVLLLLAAWWGFVRAHPLRDRCDRCGYALAGGPSRCPECGETPRGDAGRGEAHAVRPGPWVVFVFMGLLGLCMITLRGLEVADQVRSWAAGGWGAGFSAGAPVRLPRWPVVVVAGLAGAWALGTVVALVRAGRRAGR